MITLPGDKTPIYIEDSAIAENNEQLIDIAFSIFINKKDDIQKVESLLKNLTIVLSNVDLLNSLRLAKTEKPKLNIILNQIDCLLEQSKLEQES